MGVPAAASAVDAAAAVAMAACGRAAAEAAEAAAARCSSGELNQMRSALLAADCLVTVSRGYAVEVQQEGPFGCGLQDILAARGIRCAGHAAAAVGLRACVPHGFVWSAGLQAFRLRHSAMSHVPFACLAHAPTLALLCWLQWHHEWH